MLLYWRQKTELQQLYLKEFRLSESLSITFSTFKFFIITFNDLSNLADTVVIFNLQLNLLKNHIFNSMRHSAYQSKTNSLKRRVMSKHILKYKVLTFWWVIYKLYAEKKHHASFIIL